LTGILPPIGRVSIGTVAPPSKKQPITWCANAPKQDLRVRADWNERAFRTSAPAIRFQGTQNNGLRRVKKIKQQVTRPGRF